MLDMKTQLADYFDHVVQRVDVADIVAEDSAGPDPSGAAQGELFLAGGGHDLTVFEIRELDGSNAPSVRS